MSRYSSGNWILRYALWKKFASYNRGIGGYSIVKCSPLPWFFVIIIMIILLVSLFFDRFFNIFY